MDPFLKRILALILVIVLGITVLIVGLLSNSEKDLGSGQEYSSPTGPAIMNDSEELYRILDDDAQFTNLREDLAYFGRTTIGSYREGKVLDVVFKVSKVESRGDDVFFEGAFSEEKSKISGQITPLNYGKIMTSITNTTTGTEIDSTLPSNSARSLFIGSLPLDKDDYSINYSLSSDSFLVTLYETDSSLSDAAEKDIMTGLGVDNMNNTKVEYILPTQFGN